jgi:micrococcal nuclease
MRFEPIYSSLEAIMLRPALGLLAIATLAAVVAVSSGNDSAKPAAAGTFRDRCEVDKVIDGDTFTCLEGPTIRILQINAPEKASCGGYWSTLALSRIFLPLGTEVRLEYDTVRTDQYGRTLAAPIVRGTDGNDYNIGIVMVYVGLARAAYYRDNARYLDWANASETWARNAGWNMWAPGGPFNGATDCGPNPL